MLICPECKYEYEEGFSFCSDCGCQLIEKPQVDERNTNYGGQDDLSWLKGFGNITATKAISILFYLSIVPFFISSIMFGKYIYLTSTYFKDITFMENDQQMFTQTIVNNLPLAVFLASIYFVLGILIWKIICELLIIIFRCFETYVRKNS